MVNHYHRSFNLNRYIIEYSPLWLKSKNYDLVDYLLFNRIFFLLVDIFQASCDVWHTRLITVQAILLISFFTLNTFTQPIQSYSIPLPPIHQTTSEHILCYNSSSLSIHDKCNRSTEWPTSKHVLITQISSGNSICFRYELRHICASNKTNQPTQFARHRRPLFFDQKVCIQIIRITHTYLYVYQEIARWRIVRIVWVNRFGLISYQCIQQHCSWFLFSVTGDVCIVFCCPYGVCTQNWFN